LLGYHLDWNQQQLNSLKEEGMPIRRTTHRSSKGTKLYAVRDSKGRFKDIQTYKRAHAADMRRKSRAETAAKLKKGK
jgi:hypothetical protein